MAFDKAEIGLGIIGLGMGSGCFVAHQLTESTMRVRGICDTNPDRLEAAARKHEVPFATQDVAELLRRPEIDVVGVYSPDPLHAGHVVAALEAGKHVICTKPMVTSLAEARAILEAVRRTGLKLLVGQTYRFIERNRTAKWLADSGRYGRVLYVEATYNHDLRDTFTSTPWRYQMPQNFLFGGLCHPTDLAFWIGGRITEVSAFSHCSGLDPRYPPDVPDNYVVNLRFASGALGRVIGMYQFVHPEGMPYMVLTIAGTEAGSCGGKVTWAPPGGERRVESIADLRPAPAISVSTGGHAGEVARYLLHFEECLRQDREPEPGALEGTRVIAALEAVGESARTGRSAVPEWEF